MFAGNGAEQVFNFVFVVILARLLGAESFGLVMMAMVFVLLAEFMVGDSITDSLIQLPDLKTGHLDAVFWLLCALAAVLSLCLVIFGDAIAAFYGEPVVSDYLLWLWPAVAILAVCGVPTAILQRKLEFRILSIRAIFGVLTGGFVGIAMALTDCGPWSLVGQRLAQVFVNNILVWFAVDWRPGFRMTRSHFRDILGFSLNMLGLRMSELVSMRTPAVVIGAVLGPAALGHFTIAWRVVESISFVLVHPIRLVAKPAFAHERRNAGKTSELLADLTEVSMILGAASFLGLAVVATPLVSVFFGDSWEPVAGTLQVLCLVGVFMTIERLQQAFCLALGYAGKLFALSVAEMVLGIVLMALAAPAGLVFVAVAYTARYYILWPVRFHIVRGVGGIDIRHYVRIAVLPLALSISMALVVVAWRTLMGDHLSDLLDLFSSALIGGVVYLALVWIFMRERVLRGIAFVKAMREPAEEVDPPLSNAASQPGAGE
jgi:PST family polysaccharide transporter